MENEHRAGDNAGSSLRIAFVISSLRMGGAERVLSLVANGLADRGHKVSVLTFQPEDTAPHYPLSPSIALRQLDLATHGGSFLSGLGNNLRRIRTLRRQLRRLAPDAVVAFMDATSVLCILATRGLAMPVFAAEHIDPAHHDIGPIWTMLRQLSYPFATKVLLLTSGIDAYFSPRIRARCVVMPNPVEVDCSGDPQLELHGQAVVGMGRLHPQKGFDLLLRAFAKIVQQHPKAMLWILGEGPERGVLEALRDALGLSGRAFLPGAVTNPGPVLRQAEVFALPSRYEGFPLALCEALACGLPAVSTRFSVGVKDIAHHEENALVIPPNDVDVLSMALDRLLGDEALRARLAAAAPLILQRYGLESVLDRWEALILPTLARTRKA